MTVGTISLGGDNASDFSLGGTCAEGTSLSSGGSCAVTVTFTPVAAGIRSATLTVIASLPSLGSNATTWNSTITDPVNVTLTSTLTGTGIISTDSIVIDPVTSTTLYAGLNGAGVYKSVNSGTSWTAATTQPSDTRIKALVINKSDTTKLYVATYGGGVFKSADSGVTWVACATNPTNLNVVSLVIDGNGKLYAGTEAGVFVSADACATWTAINTGLPE
jgi:ligand-binding sensor domain-containing protein